MKGSLGLDRVASSWAARGEAVALHRDRGRCGRRQRRPLVSIGMILWWLAQPVGAEEPTPQSGRAVATASPSEETRSSFHHLATWVAGLPIRSPSLVVVAPLRVEELDLPADGVERLHQDLVDLVVTAVPHSKERVETPLPLSAARSLARRRNLPLVYLSPRLDNRGLQLDARVISFARSFWQQARAPLGKTTWRGSQLAPLDAMLRRYLPASSFSPTTLFRGRLPLAMPLAIACEPSTKEKRTRFVVVGRSEIALLERRSEGLKALHGAAWKSLSEVAPAPLRAPLGAVTWEAGNIWVGSSDRADSILLDDHLSSAQRLPRSLPLGRGWCAAFTSRGVADPQRCPSSTPEDPEPAPSEWDWVTTKRFVEATGAVTELFAGVPLGSAHAEVRISGPLQGSRTHTLSGVAGPMAFADLNGDGLVELVTTSASTHESDALIITTFEQSGPREVVRLETPPLKALAVCPLSGENPRHLLLSTDTEVWEIRP